MLKHYVKLGVESFVINVHLTRKDDPILEEIRSITKDFGAPIASVSVGNWLEVLRRVYRESRARYPHDWHILADQDEFQVYPMKLSEVEVVCRENGYDYVCGCWVDRLAADGGFPSLNASPSIWEQFPVGAFLSYPVGAADPRKVVLAKSNVDVCVGQHLAWNGRACPVSQIFVQVHHFKWTGGIIAELEARAKLLKQGGYGFHIESSRFAKYFRDNGGVVNLQDRRILAATCHEDYVHWPLIRQWFILLNNYIELGKKFIPGPATLSLDLESIALTATNWLTTLQGGDVSPNSQLQQPTFGLEPIREIWFKSRN